MNYLAFSGESTPYLPCCAHEYRTVERRRQARGCFLRRGLTRSVNRERSMRWQYYGSLVRVVPGLAPFWRPSTVFDYQWTSTVD